MHNGQDKESSSALPRTKKQAFFEDAWSVISATSALLSLKGLANCTVFSNGEGKNFYLLNCLAQRTGASSFLNCNNVFI